MTRKTATTMLAAVVVGYALLGATSVAMAAEAPAKHEGGFTTGLFDSQGAAAFGATIGAGLVVIGGGKGISGIGGRAVESMARQPEAAGTIQVAMIITAAMIEGATLFAVVVCLLALP